MTDGTEEFDPFKGESGFKDDYDGVVEEAWFAAGDYGVNLHLKIIADDGEEVENRYPTGPDWETFDGGDTVEHPKGERKGFNKNTRYFQLIGTAMGLEGVEGLLRERSRALDGKGPKAAALWKGLKFHWNVMTESKTFKDKDTQEKVTKDVSTVLPTAFLGTSEGSVPTATPAASAPAASPGTPVASAEVPAPASDSTQAIPPNLLVPLKAAAKQAATFTEFADAAMEVPGVLENNDVMGKIVDEAFYTSLRAG